MHEPEWPDRWIDRVRLFRERIKEEAFRVCVMSSPPGPRYLLEDTTRLGENIGRWGRFVSYFPIGRVKDG